MKIIIKRDTCTLNICYSIFYNSQDIVTTQMTIDGYMDTEIVVYVYNGILLSYKKQHIQVSSNEMDEPRPYYTECSMSERERQICYITHAYGIQKIDTDEPPLQGSNGDTDIENRLVDPARERGWDK